MTSPTPIRVLLICHEPARMAALAPRLESMGFQCDQARAAAAAPGGDAAGAHDVIVALESSGSLQVLRPLPENPPPILVLAGTATAADRAEALASPDSAVWDWVEASCPDRELAARISKLARVHRMRLEIEDLTRRCAEMDTVDRLTGLPNHRAFQECLGKEMRRAERYESPLALILIDIDRFRSINETFGHLWGDRVLQDLARRARELLRDTDMIGRYGADELAMLLPETDATAAALVADRIRSLVAQAGEDLRGRLPASQSGSAGSFQLTVRLGLACYPSEGITTRAQLLSTAEAALRPARRQEKGRAAPPRAS